jgi:hypothetical protein
MIENANLQAILETASDVSTVCEIYDADAVPTEDGLDPADALGCFAAVGGITFSGQDYTKLVTRFGRVKKTTTGEVGSTSVSFSNVTREIADFEFTHGFDGLIMCVRTLSRSQSIALTDTQILFVGRCEKPDGGDKESIDVTAKSITGSIEVFIPRRKYGKDDVEGRVETDPEFEGFPFSPQYGSVAYARKEKKGGFLGWWNKKWVRHTLNYSSYSTLDANKYVPEVFGAAQMLGTVIAARDTGGFIELRLAWCEGEIYDIINHRSIDPELPLHAPTYQLMLGKVGVLNTDNPSWVGPGYYSRTAELLLSASNSPVDVNEPGPDVAAVVLGRIMEIPDTSNVWSGAEWTDDAAAHTRFLYTSPDYYNLDDAWIDDDYFGDCYHFNSEYIFNSEVSDFTFVEEG